MNFMSFGNEQAADLIDRLRAQPTHVFTNCSPLEFGVLVPRSQPHDGSQLDVILRQILHLIIRVVAPESNAREPQNVPVVHTFPASLRRRLAVDVSADKLHDLFSGVRVGIHMLKRPQHRYDRVATIKIQLDLIDRWTVQAKLGRV